MSEGRFPLEAKLVWISTRRTAALAEVLAANVVGVYLLHRMLADVTLPLEELSVAHLVAIGGPPTTLANFEHDLLRSVAKTRKLGPHVVVVV